MLITVVISIQIQVGLRSGDDGHWIRGLLINPVRNNAEGWIDPDDLIDAYHLHPTAERLGRTT